jgi:hypothetical protein
VALVGAEMAVKVVFQLESKFMASSIDRFWLSWLRLLSLLPSETLVSDEQAGGVVDVAVVFVASGGSLAPLDGVSIVVRLSFVELFTRRRSWSCVHFSMVKSMVTGCSGIYGTSVYDLPTDK